MREHWDWEGRGIGKKLTIWQRSSRPRRTPEVAEREMPQDQWGELC